MKIGIDISQIVYGTGVSVYTKNLVENLLKIDKNNSYILFGGSLRRKADLKKFTNTLKGNYQEKFTLLSPFLADLFWNRLHTLKIECLIGKIDVIHTSDWAQPPSDAFKVTTIHDLSPVRYPKLTHPKIVSLYDSMLKWVKKECDRIIVPSKATKEDLALLNFKRDRIRVIPEAVDSFFQKDAAEIIAKIKRKHNIKTDYLLSVGVGERKNTNRIIKAFEMLNRDNLELIFVGRGEYKSENKNIKFLGYVSDFDLRSLYSGAQALVYPSIYEGFGLTILQAFACQCPVVTSNVSSMPEVAGKAAILVNPFSADSISQGILKAIQDRSGLIKKGLKRSKEFSWEKNARQTLSVYQETLTANS